MKKNLLILLENDNGWRSAQTASLQRTCEERGMELKAVKFLSELTVEDLSRGAMLVMGERFTAGPGKLEEPFTTRIFDVQCSALAFSTHITKGRFDSEDLTIKNIPIIVTGTDFTVPFPEGVLRIRKQPQSHLVGAVGRWLDRSDNPDVGLKIVRANAQEQRLSEAGAGTPGIKS